LPLKNTLFHLQSLGLKFILLFAKLFPDTSH